MKWRPILIPLLGFFLTVFKPSKSDTSCPDIEISGSKWCGTRDQCFINGNYQWNDTSKLLMAGIAMRNCHCDGLCWTYGDCCKDVYDMMDDSASQPWGEQKPLPEYSQATYDCIHPANLSSLNVDYSSPVYVVNKCPSRWSDEEVKGQCENPSDNFDNPFLGWPVSNSNGVLYHNMYCAMCNEEKSYLYWNVEIRCNDPTFNISVNSREELRKLLQERLRSGACELLYHPPLRVSYRPCKPVIDKCHPDWQEGSCDFKEKCEQGDNSYVYRSGFMSGPRLPAYKNKYCAMCNNDNALTCMDMPTIVPHEPHFSGTYPLSFLLDLNTGSGQVTGHDIGHVTGSLINETVTEVKTCDQGRVYDPFNDLCRLVSCRTGFVFQGGKCVQDSPTAGVLLPGSGNFDCLRVTINITEYTVFENGSLLFTEVGEIHTKDTYEVLPDGSALVCTNFTQNLTITTVYFKHEVNLKFSSAQSILSVVGQVISLVGLAIQLTVYSLLPKLRNLAGKNLMCLSASLFCGQLFFLTGSSASGIYPACALLAILTHYSFLASFGWMNVMAYDIWKTFAKSSKPSSTDNSTRKFLQYCLFSWGGSLLIILVAIIVNYSTDDNVVRPGYGETICWIRYRPALILFFAAPVAVILAVNLIFYVMTIISIYKISKMAKLVTQKADKNRLWLYIKLSSIMGLTWIFGFIAASFDSHVLWYFFIIFNSLQGAFICISFVFTSQVLKLFREKFSGVYKPVSGSDPGTRTSAVSSGGRHSSYVPSETNSTSGLKVNKV